jgi:DNA polymerase-3 subunit epsilon
MKVLIFDTETTGLPKTRIIGQDTLNSWPHIVQFSFIVFDTNKNEIIIEKDFIIKMIDGIEISQDSSNIHGITNEISREKGTSIEDVLCRFFYYLREVDLLVGHNISFDINMVNVELLRIIYNKTYPREHISAYKSDLHLLANFKNIFCTMQETIDLCAIKTLDRNGQEYNKYPKLSELHEKMFGTIPKNMHNSLVDILITLRCFMKLKFDKDLLQDCRNFIETTKKLDLLL